MDFDLAKAAFGLAACGAGSLMVALSFVAKYDVDNGAIALGGAIIVAGGVIAVSISQLPGQKR